MLVNSINIFFDFIGYQIIVFFIYKRSGYKFHIAKAVLNGLLFSIGSTSMSSTLNHFLPVYASIATPVTGISLQIICLYLTFKTSIKAIFIYTVVVDVISGLANVVAFLVFKLLGISTDLTYLSQSPSLMLLGQIITNGGTIIILAASLYFSKIFKGVLGKNKTATFIAATIFTIFAINIGVYLVLLRMYNLDKLFFFVIPILLSIYCVFTFYILRKLQNYDDLKKELSQQEFYNNSLKNTLEGFRRYRHDFNNNLTVILGMIRLDKKDALVKYLQEITGMNSNLNNGDSLLSLNNAAIHGLITAKLNYSEKMKAAFVVKIMDEVSDIPHIRMMDLCEVLGILIDNAIEAVAGKTENEVELVLEGNGEKIKFTIDNHFDSDMETFNQIRTKADYSSKGEGRGSGLGIIRNIIKANRHVYLNTYLLEENKLLRQELVIEVN